MRIVHVVYSLNMGGAEVIVRQLARLHRSQGHDVSVICYAELGVIGQQMVDEGFSVRCLGQAPVPVTMLRFWKLFADLQPDAVHCHNVAATIQAAMSARLAGVRCVVTTRHRLELHPYDLPAELRYNLASRFCHHIACICGVTADGVLRGPFAAKNKVLVVYNGTEPVTPTPADDLRQEAGQPRGFLLLYIGRLVREKALDRLLRSVQMARASVPGLCCWIVGDGADRSALEALALELGIQDSVRFWGLRMDTPPFYTAADAFVMSSISEGLPMSLLQSMSLGTPSILTDVDGMGEVLRMTGGGLLVPVGDEAAFADAIVRLATDPALHAELSAKALQAYRNSFTLEIMAGQYMHLYSTPYSGL